MVIAACQVADAILDMEIKRVKLLNVLGNLKIAKLVAVTFSYI